MKAPTRRHVLRGAGVALALPWLESLAPRPARGQATARPIRFVPIYFPMGTASFWAPAAAPGAADWRLSPILEPLAPVKSHVTVLRHVDNTAYGAANVSPAFCRETGAFLTCAPAVGMPPRNGISVDQVIARNKVGVVPGLESLQLGLSTISSSTEDLPPEFSRSVSWLSPSEPLPTVIDPQAVFDQLTSSAPDRLGPAVTDPMVAARRATRRSVLDFVIGDATVLQPRLSYSDRARLDQFMTSVQEVEQRIRAVAPPPPTGCTPIPRPKDAIAVGKVPAGYNRDAHADVMIDLMVLALACDATRVISLMLDDARTDFIYNFTKERLFTPTGSTPGTAPVGGYRALATSAGLTNNGYATINHWFVTKVAALCQRLASLSDGPGMTVLDNSVVWFGSGMHDGVTRSMFDLPVLYVGGGGGVLKQNAHLDLSVGGAGRRLSDVYLTVIQKVFNAPETAFADSHAIVPEILA